MTEPAAEDLPPELLNDLHHEPFVVVETDPQEVGYDAQMASWWQRAQHAPQLPFPRAHGLSADELSREFDDVLVADGQDPLWYCRLQLRRGVRRTPAPRGPGIDWQVVFRIGAAHGLLSLAGYRVAEHVSLPDWLDARLGERGWQVISSRPYPRDGQFMADVLVCRERHGRSSVGRVTTLRRGDRVIVLGIRVPRETYVSVAYDFVVARDSLRMLSR